MVQKMTCQLDMLNTKPPTVGPSAGATEITTEIMPITLPRRCGGTRVIATVISVGIIKAVPAAWNTRPTSSTPKAGASAASTVPARNTPDDAKKICRVVNLSMRKPVVGMTTPMVRRKPVSSHWAEVAGIPKSAMMVGSATDRAVSFRIITIAPRTRMVRLIFTSAEMWGSGF